LHRSHTPHQQQRERHSSSSERITKKTALIATSFLLYWAGLQKEDDKGVLEVGAGALKEAALAFHPQVQLSDDQRDGMLMLQ
jgi:hypothetical protein